MYTPDLVVILGPRSYLTLAGILTVVASLWYYERKWDEEGPAAYSEALENSGEDYHIVEDGKKVKYVNNPDGSRDAISISTEEFKEDDMVEIPTEELSKAMPLPIGLIAGFGIWAVGMLFDNDGSTDIAFNWNIFYLFFLPAIAFLIAYPIRKATVKRDLNLKKKAVSGVFLAVIFLVFCSIFDGNTDGSWPFCIFGGRWECTLGAIAYLDLPSVLQEKPFSLPSPFPLRLLSHPSPVKKNGGQLGDSWRAKR